MILDAHFFIVRGKARVWGELGGGEKITALLGMLPRSFLGQVVFHPRI